MKYLLLDGKTLMFAVKHVFELINAKEEVLDE